MAAGTGAAPGSGAIAKWYASSLVPMRSNSWAGKYDYCFACGVFAWDNHLDVECKRHAKNLWWWKDKTVEQRISHSLEHSSAEPHAVQTLSTLFTSQEAEQRFPDIVQEWEETLIAQGHQVQAWMLNRAPAATAACLPPPFTAALAAPLLPPPAALATSATPPAAPQPQRRWQAGPPAAPPGLDSHALAVAIDIAAMKVEITEMRTTIAGLDAAEDIAAMQIEIRGLKDTIAMLDQVLKAQQVEMLMLQRRIEQVSDDIPVAVAVPAGPVTVPI